MTTSKIAAALVAAQKDMPLIPKSGTNPRFGYRYSTLADYVSHCSPVLSYHGLALTFSVDDMVILAPRQNQNAVRVYLSVTLTHSSGESISIKSAGEGQDPGDKAVYKAITGARKYGMACLFGLATSDDPERETNEDEPPAAEPPAPQAKQPKRKAAVAHPPKIVDAPPQQQSIIEEKKTSAVEYFQFEGITESDLAFYLDKPPADWDRDDLMKLGGLKDDVDNLRKIIRNKRSAA